MIRFSLCLALLSFSCVSRDKIDLDSGSLNPDPNLDIDGDGFYGDEDCDDNNSNTNPAAIEICDGVDNNCDGDIDEEVATRFYLDTDSDGFGDDSEFLDACEAPEGYAAIGGDCDDLDEEVYPSAPEQCDGLDNNCNGIVDEELSFDWYLDSDGDGYGDIDALFVSCLQPENYVDNADDCDDQDADISPEAEEICDEKDNNCNEEIDEDTGTIYYRDLDIDGFGSIDDSVYSCEPVAGYILVGGDCDDFDTYVNPDADETCFDGIDNNCDGLTDDSTAIDATLYYDDLDGDNFGDPLTPQFSCYPPPQSSIDNTDCDDSSAFSYPGSIEVCDGVLNDCVNSSVLSSDEIDDDGDGQVECVIDVNGWNGDPFVVSGGDCDDSDPLVFLGAPELCDGIANDCTTPNTPLTEIDNDGDGYVECVFDPTIWLGSSSVIGGEDCDDNDSLYHLSINLYQDADNDSYGNPNAQQLACGPLPGYVFDNADCDDSDNTVYPSASELCDGQINDCNASAIPSSELDDDLDGYVECLIDAGGWDGGSSILGGSDCDDTNGAFFALSMWYYDNDGDGYGNSNVSISSCVQPAGYVLQPGDCNDASLAIFPGSAEYCNNQDDDCDGLIDESNAIGESIYYLDADGDGYGNPNSSISACSAPTGYVGNSLDCNDGSSAAFPGAVEVCNGIDDDCDNQIDEAGSQNSQLYYIDNDGDGYGSSILSQLACSQPNGYANNATDCNDGNSMVNPGAYEMCNGIDDDCDNQIDEASALDALSYYMDSDGDGFGNPQQPFSSCSQPSGYVSNSLDCNDGNAFVNPNATEVCNNQDDDCDGTVDEGSAGGSIYYLDSDGDGYGSSSQTITSCQLPSGYATNSDDCNDSNVSVNPGASEQCNLTDSNCNGQIDEGASCRVGIYVGYRTDADAWFYTSNVTEYNSTPNLNGFGISYFLYASPAPGLSAFYRCYSSQWDSHFYTTSSNCEGLSHMSNEGILGYIAQSQISNTTNLYRAHRFIQPKTHHFTRNLNQHQILINLANWNDEGTAGYVWSASN